MTPEKSGLGEQALNKIAEIALASQLGEVERLEVQVKTDLNKLAHGEVEAIAININGLVMQHELRVEEMQLQLDSVTVKPFSALLGKIVLTQPCKGTASIVINEDAFNRAVNSKSFNNLHPIQDYINNQEVEINVQQVKCLLTDGNIVFNFQLLVTGESLLSVFTATLGIDANGRIKLQDIQYVNGKEITPKLILALNAQLNEILSLQKFAQMGMLLQIDQIDITSGKLTLLSNAYIDQFPS